MIHTSNLVKGQADGKHSIHARNDGKEKENGDDDESDYNIQLLSWANS